MWDNRCTHHIALNDYDQHQSRHMEKTTVKGTPSGYVYEGPLQYEGPRL
jgi:taurine dioxygenase